MRYIPTMDLVLQFERSGRWPDDLAAIQKTKLAFFETIGTALMKKLPGLRASDVTGENDASTGISDQACLELLTADGWAFSLRIWHDREATLLQRALEKKPPVSNKDHKCPPTQPRWNGNRRRKLCDDTRGALYMPLDITGRWRLCAIDFRHTQERCD